MLRNQFVAETVKNTEFHKSEFHKVGFSLRFETARTAFKQIFVECTTIKMENRKKGAQRQKHV